MNDLLWLVRLNLARRKKKAAKQWVYDYTFGRHPKATVADYERKRKQWTEANLTIEQAATKLFGIKPLFPTPEDTFK